MQFVIKYVLSALVIVMLCAVFYSMVMRTDNGKSPSSMNTSQLQQQAAHTDLLRVSQG